MAAPVALIFLVLIVSMAMARANPFPHETEVSSNAKDELNFHEMLRELFPDAGSRGPPKISSARNRRTDGSNRNLVCNGMCQCYSRFHREYFCCQCLDNTCFPGDATVQTEDNLEKRMDELRLGDRILAATANGTAIFSRVIAFLDRRPRLRATYVTIATETGSEIPLSGNHLIYKVGPNNGSETGFADDLVIGDVVYISGHSKSDLLRTAKIAQITREIREGAYVPLTETGTLFVNGILASCYASFDHEWAHFVLAPVRWFPWVFESKDSQLVDGVRPYIRVLKWIARTFLPSSLRYPTATKTPYQMTDSFPNLSLDLYTALYYTALSV